MLPIIAALTLVSAFTGTINAAAVNKGYVAPYATGIGLESAFAKAKALVGQMTLAEKLNLTVWGNGVPRLGFSGYNAADGGNGPAGTFTTPHSAFENSITLAGSLDRDLMYERGYLSGQQLRNKGYGVLFGPNANMLRAPAAGRNPEAYGPEPYLTGVGAAQMVKGVQDAGVIAVTKHLVGDEQEHGRFLQSSNIDDKALHEVYLFPFGDAISAGTLGTMCSYNKINGTYACNNANLMGELYKGELDYQTFIVSDFQAERSGPPSFTNGLDAQLGISTFDTPGQLFRDYGGYRLGQNLTDFVNNGTIPLARVNDAATRLMTPYFALRQDNINFPRLPNNISVGGAKDIAHIRLAGAASAVLLKNNNNALPLNKPKHLALFGFDAAAGPGGPNLAGLGLKVNENPPVFIPLGPTGAGATGHWAGSWGYSYYTKLVYPNNALAAKAKQDGSSYTYTQNNYDLAAIKKAASANSDATCLAFGGAHSGEETDRYDNANAGDRQNLTLWQGADAMIEAVASSCKNTIVIINAGSAVDMPWADHENITAIVFAGYPGEQSGNALVDVLYGAYNPSAKLPFTIAYKDSDYPAQVDYNVTDFTPYDVNITYSEGVFLDYRWFDEKNITPRFEFMHGLSYTSFSYSKASVKKTGKGKAKRWSNPGGPKQWYEEEYSVTVTVKNSGKVAGNATPQLYIGFPAGTGEPPKVMRGFEKTYLKPGQSAKLTFALRYKDISIWDTPSQNFVIPSGKLVAYIGESSRKIVATVNLQS